MGSSGQSVLRILKHKSLNLNMPGKDDDRIDMTNEGDDEESALGGCVGTFLWIISMFLIVITFPLSLFVTMKQVKQYERAVILRLGKLKKGGPFGPGLFFVVPCLDDIITVDLRTVTFDVPPQEILTKDSVTVAVDAVVYFKVFNPMYSVVNVANASQSTRLLASTTLRNILGTKNCMTFCLTERKLQNQCCPISTQQQIHGESGLRGLRSRMSDFLNNFKGQWQLRLRPPDKQEPRLLRLRVNRRHLKLSRMPLTLSVLLLLLCN